MGCSSRLSARDSEEARGAGDHVRLVQIADCPRKPKNDCALPTGKACADLFWPSPDRLPATHHSWLHGGTSSPVLAPRVASGTPPGLLRPNQGSRRSATGTTLHSGKSVSLLPPGPGR